MLCLPVVLLPALALSSPLSFFVSPPPAGSDVTGNGSVLAPWASWSHAALAIRPLLPSMDDDISVSFASGVYALNASITLEVEDSGQNGHSVIYRGLAPPGVALFDGGVPISDTDWSELPGASGVFVAPLPVATRELYAFGTRMTESVAPGVNLTASNTNVTTWGYITSDEALIAAVSAPGSLVLAADVEFLYTSAGAQWQEARARVASWALVPPAVTAAIDDVGSVAMTILNISMMQPGWTLIRNKGYPETFPTGVVNVLQPSLLASGQGVISPTRGTVYYRPPSSAGDGGMSGAGAWAAALNGPLLLLQGIAAVPPTPPSPIFNVIIANVSFRGSTWLAPTNDGAYAPDQGGIIYLPSDLPLPLAHHALHPVPAAVTLSTVLNVTLAGISVAHVGGTGIAVEGGSQVVSIQRSSIFDVGCSGVRLGEVEDAEGVDASTFNTRLTLSDSSLSGLAATYRDCSGLFGGFISNSTIEHNEIVNMSWAGLTLGWGGWGGCSYRPSLGGNRILSNHISQVNLVTGDGGPIYVMAQQPSSANCDPNDLTCRSEIAGNFVSYAIHHAAMLYHDEGSEFFFTHGNVVDQPTNFTDPHGWWWAWAAAWASTEFNILITENFARGVNRTDLFDGNNLVVINNTFIPEGAPWPAVAQAIVDMAGPRSS